MSVVYINYKIAICDICGKTEEFDTLNHLTGIR